MYKHNANIVFFSKTLIFSAFFLRNLKNKPMKTTDKVYIAGADIGGSHISSCVVDLVSGNILPGTHFTEPIDSQSTAREIVVGWTVCLDRSISASHVKVSGVGLAFPGPFDYDKGISLVEGVNKFEHIFGLDVGASIAGYMAGSPLPVRYVNDASAFALGEYMSGCARGKKKVVCLTLGSGVGSAFLENGRLVTSAPGVPANGWVYCLPFEDTIVDDSFSTRWFVHRYAALTGRSVNGALPIAQAAAHDSAAKNLFNEYGCRLATFAAQLCRDFDCTDLVLGGSITGSFHLFAPAMKQTLARMDSPIEVQVCSLGDSAAMVGGASLFANY